jgi:hypothetical protein
VLYIQVTLDTWFRRFFASSTRRFVVLYALLESIYAEPDCTCAWSLRHCAPCVAFTTPPRPTLDGLAAATPPLVRVLGMYLGSRVQLHLCPGDHPHTPLYALSPFPQTSCHPVILSSAHPPISHSINTPSNPIASTRLLYLLNGPRTTYTEPCASASIAQTTGNRLGGGAVSPAAMDVEAWDVVVDRREWC